MQTIPTLLEEELHKLQQTIIAKHEQAGQVATGRTRNAITYSVNGDSGTLEAPSWLATLEQGRGPAKGKGDKQAFVENLKAWIVAKGIPFKDEADLERLAGFFRWYINRFGTKLYRSGGRADIFTPALETFADSLAKRSAEVYAEQLLSGL